MIRTYMKNPILYTNIELISYHNSSFKQAHFNSKRSKSINYVVTDLTLTIRVIDMISKEVLYSYDTPLQSFKTSSESYNAFKKRLSIGEIDLINYDYSEIIMILKHKKYIQ